MGVKSSGLLSHQRHAGWAAFRQGMTVCGQCCKGYPLIPTSRKSLTQGGGAEERDSQPAQRDELAHSRTVPTRGGVLPPANDPSPTAITENTGSLQG